MELAGNYCIVDFEINILSLFPHVNRTQEKKLRSEYYLKYKYGKVSIVLFITDPQLKLISR